MPHFGLMNEKALGPAKGPFMRARLHIRGGKRRLREGKISAGLVTLYDALEAAMSSYIETPGSPIRLVVQKGENLNNESVLYGVLVRAGVLDGKFDFDAFQQVVDRALNEELPDYDYRELLNELVAVMTQLGVMPFDEAALPPEDPTTF
jgi:hypothetical protein